MDAAALNLIDRVCKAALERTNEGGFHRTKVAEHATAAAVCTWQLQFARGRCGRTPRKFRRTQ